MADLAQLVGQLKPVQAGTPMQDVVTASRINAIQELLRALVRGDNIAGGLNILKRASNGGVVLSSNTKRSTGAGGGGGSSGPYPFDVSFTPDTPPNIIAAVRPGTVNGLIPSDYADTYTFADNVTRFLVLTCTSTDGEITGATLSMETTAPAAIPVLMGAPPTSFAFLLGLVVNGVWYRTAGNGSLSMTATEVFRTDKVTPTPGTLPYDLWFTWVPGTA